MNLKQICEGVLNESDGRAVQMASVALGRDAAGDLYLTNSTHRNIVQWVVSEYKRIQLYSPAWEFHRKRGAFITAAANIESYIKRNVRRIDRDSGYFIQTGQTARQPLTFQSYSWWLRQQQVDGISTASSPTTLIKGPNDTWHLWPTPTTAGIVYADWTVKVDSLVDADDEPCWDEHYHEMLVWGALQLYAAEFTGEGSRDKLIARAQRMYPPMWDAFCSDYILEPEGPGTLF